MAVFFEEPGMIEESRSRGVEELNETHRDEKPFRSQYRWRAFIRIASSLYRALDRVAPVGPPPIFCLCLLWLCKANSDSAWSNHYTLTEIKKHEQRFFNVYYYYVCKSSYQKDLSENTKNKHDKLVEELAGELEQYLQVNCFEDPLLEFRALIHFQLPVDALLSTHAKSDASSVDVPPYEVRKFVFLLSLSTQRPQDPVICCWLLSLFLMVLYFKNAHYKWKTHRSHSSIALSLCQIKSHQEN